jgi:glycosyltransferase involved in cell wall biosynthesis
MHHLVSVVFTSYNHIEFLNQALESLVNQTYKDFELIIVDDCSTDGSQEIIESFLSKYPDLIKPFLLDKNTGSYVKASNFGASHATGDYILFAQCDDYCNKNQIESLLEPFTFNPTIGVAFSKSNLVDRNGVFLGDDYKFRSSAFKRACKTNTIISCRKMRKFLTHSCVIPNLSAAMIKRDLFFFNGGLSEKYLMAADWAFWFEMSEKTDFFYISEPLNNFRQHDTTIRKNTKLSKQIGEIYEIFYDHILKHKISFIKSLNFRIGAARIWMMYFIEDRKLFISTFRSLFRELKKIDTGIIVYLFFVIPSIIIEIVKIYLKKISLQIKPISTP